ncbi:MAG: hypothetical protein Tsb008_10600 [Rhodothalassiaceae bacterium]
MTAFAIADEGAGDFRAAVLEPDGTIRRLVVALRGEADAGAVSMARIVQRLEDAKASLLDLGDGRTGFMPDAARPRGPRPEIGSRLPVLITAPPRESGKGYAVRGDFRLRGRHMLLDPFRPGIRMQGKAPPPSADTSARLVAIVQEAGLVLLDSSAAMPFDYLAGEARRLAMDAARIAEAVKGKSLGEILPTPDPAARFLRDLPFDVTAITVEDSALLARLQRLAGLWAPDLVDRMTPNRDRMALFERFGVEERIAALLEGRIALPSGGSLHLEETRAGLVIDVDAGPGTGLAANCEAAQEIPRLLRELSVGGLVIVDFIEGMSGEEQRRLLALLDHGLARDDFPVARSRPTTHGVLSLSRRRDGLSLRERMLERRGTVPSLRARLAACLRTWEKEAARAPQSSLVLPASLAALFDDGHRERLRERLGFLPVIVTEDFKTRGGKDGI